MGMRECLQAPAMLCMHASDGTAPLSARLQNVGAIIDEMVDPRKRAIATATIMASLAVLAVGFDCVYLSYTSQM
jgi:hypothetical protein